MDFISALPKSEGYGSIMVVVDRYSKYATFIAAPTDCKADEAADLFIKHIIKLWRVPKSIVSDRDPCFTGRFWTELFKMLGTDLKFSSSFHPQMDGQTNHINSLLEMYIRHYVVLTSEIGLSCWTLPNSYTTYNGARLRARVHSRSSWDFS